LIHFVNACFASLTHDRHVTHVFSFIDSTVFLWLNIDQAITVNSFVYETNIDFFYSRTFQHLFRRFDVTLHSPLKIRQARQKIEDFSDVTFTSSLKHYCRIEHFNKHFCVVVKLQHIQTITLHTRTFDSESFGYWNTRLTLAWFRSSLVVSLCTQEPPPLQLSSGAAEQFHFF